MKENKQKEIFEIINTLGLSRVRVAEMMDIKQQSFYDKSNEKNPRFFNDKNLNDLKDKCKENYRKMKLLR